MSSFAKRKIDSPQMRAQPRETVNFDRCSDVKNKVTVRMLG